MNRVQIKLVKDALDELDDLSEWEAEFILDVAGRGDDYQLSDKQNAVLNRISTKLNGG